MVWFPGADRLVVDTAPANRHHNFNHHNWNRKRIFHSRASRRSDAILGLPEVLMIEMLLLSKPYMARISRNFRKRNLRRRPAVTFRGCLLLILLILLLAVPMNEPAHAQEGSTDTAPTDATGSAAKPEFVMPVIRTESPRHTLTTFVHLRSALEIALRS